MKTLLLAIFAAACLAGQAAIAQAPPPIPKADAHHALEPYPAEPIQTASR